jgi:hypothetical protein
MDGHFLERPGTAGAISCRFRSPFGRSRGTEFASFRAVRSLRQTLFVLLAVVTALLAVGLSAPADGLFSIAVQPVLWRVDAAALAESRAGALGLDVDVKLGPMHMHASWSLLPLSAPPVEKAAVPLFQMPSLRTIVRPLFPSVNGCKQRT